MWPLPEIIEQNLRAQRSWETRAGVHEPASDVLAEHTHKLCTILRVAFHFAMHDEASGFIEHFKLKALPSQRALPGGEFFQGHAGDLEIVVALNGRVTGKEIDRVGTESSTLTAYKLLNLHSCDLLINAGTAGGFRRSGSSIGDLWVSSKVAFHDHRIPLGEYDEWSRGEQETLPCPAIAGALRAKVGLISSGNSLDASDADLERLAKSGAVAKDMEAAAVAKVANDNGVPFVSIKSITDLVDGGEAVQTEFISNFEQAKRNLTAGLIEVVRLLREGRTLAEL